MIAFCKYTGFRNMIAFFVDIFCPGTFRAIPDNAKRLEFISVRFYNVTVINMYDRLCGNPFFNQTKIRSGCSSRSSMTEMSG